MLFILKISQNESQNDNGNLFKKVKMRQGLLICFFCQKKRLNG